MRVAILNPETFESTPSMSWYPKSIQQDVIAGLSAFGLDVEAVCLGAESGSDSAIKRGEATSISYLEAVSGFMEKASEYGLIFNFSGLVPMLVSSITQTPMITVIDSREYLGAPETYESRPKALCLLWCKLDNESVKPSNAAEINLCHTDRANWGGLIARELFETGNKLLKHLQKEDHRPWGYYVVLSDMDDHKVKRIVVYPKKRLSLQSHRRRSEHWLVVSGTGVVTLNSDQIRLSPGEAVDIPVGARHRMSNPGEEPVVFVEVQTGDYFGEDDIERFEDDFGRT